MHLVVIGLNYRTAPVELRERLAIPEDLLRAALSDLRSRAGASECLILSTCNRTEVYACTNARSDDEGLYAWIADYFHVSPDDLRDHLYSHAGHKAAEHLFRVASSIDSMVVGEAQILGQVKDAYEIAARCRASGSALNALFQQAIAVGKRVRTETEIGRGAFSVGSAAVHLAHSIFDRLADRAVLVIGAGEMSELTMAHLASSGAKPVLVANRTFANAERLASKFQGAAVRFEEIESTIRAADIVITSTGSSDPIITREMALRAQHERRGRPIFFIDMAVPRDIESSVGDLDNTFLYNIDDLQAVVSADVSARRAEIQRVEEIIAEEVGDFLRWFRALDAVPIITSLREKFDRIREAEFDKLKSKLPDLTPEEHDAINQAMRSVVNRICHEPMIRIKELAAGENASAKLDMICDVFGICPPDDAEEGEEH